MVPHSKPSMELSRARFERDGYLVLKALLAPAACAQLQARVIAMLDPLTGPAEFEADVGYPGAPASRDALGGHTPRRLLHAYSRDPLLRELATDARLGAYLRELICTDEVQASQCHHNCVMTKFPGYSSATAWHQDVRYWSFDRPELVTAWVALGHERADNGALELIPGSHRLELDRGRLDRELFLRPELDENRALIDRAVRLELDPGDALLFHCRLFHAAGRNGTLQTKLSVVFTYHASDNRPIPGTRSAQYPSIPLPS